MSEESNPAYDRAMEYARSYYTGSQYVIDDFELLARYRPEVVTGYLDFRKAVFNTDENAALSPKVKELIILAIEIARTKTNPAPVGHARRAVESGATLQEIAEVAGLCIMIGGMLTYQDSGRQALRAAQEHYEKLKSEGAL